MYRLPLSVRGVRIGLQGQEHAPTECWACVWLGAPAAKIDLPRDSRHRTTYLPPRAKPSTPALLPGPLLTDPDRSRLASGTTGACCGPGSTPIASPCGCHRPPRGGRGARGRACTSCQWLLRLDLGPRSPIFGQKMSTFLPHDNFETAGLLGLGLAPGSRNASRLASPEGARA